MHDRKLLVYSDGGAPRRRPYASFAAYEVDFETDWRLDLEAHARLACRTLHEPLVHVSREKLYPKKMTNSEAEARALRMAVCWAGHYCSEHPDVAEVEFCSDCESLVGGMNCLGRRYTEGMVRNDIRLIEANIRRNLKKVLLRWTWIPGDVMKASVINH